MNSSGTTTRLCGFDPVGEAFISDQKLLRGIRKGYADLYREVLGICLDRGLFDSGIVRTRELADCRDFIDTYDMVLEHERVPFITYPHEWPAPMLKEAALMHLRLFRDLAPHGLVLKDWHPYNILFNGTRPVFVDFTSIIPIENLPKEEYLTPPRVPALFKPVWDKTSAYFYEMYNRMYVPYFLLPLRMMANQHHKQAHLRLLETTMNAAGCVIAEEEAFDDSAMRRSYSRQHLMKQFALVQRGGCKKRFLDLLEEEIVSMSVFVQESGYSRYYEAKKEDFGLEPSDDWTSKQRAVYEAMKKFAPATLLDVGCNTGWFSVLAAKNGCEVIAADVDEACVDNLYERARTLSLPILPLVMDVTAPTPDVFPLDFGGTRMDVPLLISAERRLQCEMVLALAIVHHMALGQGISLSTIAKTLSGLTKKWLLVEFVKQDDALIVNEPGFFPAWNSSGRNFPWYSFDSLLSELKKYFSRLEITESHPETRSIVVCEK